MFRTTLSPGDIIMQHTHVRPLDLKNIPIDLSAHCMIYSGTNSVIHSTVGRYTSSVTKHSIYKLFEETELLGKGVVFQILDPALREAVVLQAEKAFSNPTTKFNYWNARREYKANAEHIEFFRAFRTYDRLFKEQSISKNKGISCSNFVFLMVKSAMISLLFPKGLPLDAKLQLEMIEKIRVSEGEKKLDRVPLSEFLKFEELIEKNLTKDHPYYYFLPDLFHLIKHTSLKNFVNFALSKPKLFGVAYLFYDKDNCLRPHVMNEASVTAIQKEHGIVGMKISIDSPLPKRFL